MHYSYKKHRIPLCFAWTCLITKSAGRAVAQPADVSESCWSMKSWHLHLPPCVNFLSFSPPPALSLLRTSATIYCTTAHCCWDKSCSEKSISKWGSGSLIVNFFVFSLMHCSVRFEDLFDEREPYSEGVKKEILQTRSHFQISSEKTSKWTFGFTLDNSTETRVRR